MAQPRLTTKSLSGAVPVEVDRLLLDARNPRLDFDPDETPSQDEILHRLWRDFAVDEIALSIASNGFLPFEPLIAEPVDGSGNALVVIEGNRRLAAVKLLRDGKLRRKVKATDLPVIDAAAIRSLNTLPVIITRRSETWQFVGFKHVNGPQTWGSYAKARYIAWVHDDLRISLEEIARRIGDKHATVRRLYRGFEVLAQAESEGVFTVDDRWKDSLPFSHLYTGLDYSGIAAFIGVEPDKGFSRRPVAKKDLPRLGELLVWLFGSKSKEAAPVIRTQNPDLRMLDDVLKSKDGVAALRKQLPLAASYDIARGDEQIFRNAMTAAKQNLREARGTVLTEYSRDADLLATGEDIVKLARDIRRDMQEIENGSAKSKGD